MRRVYCSFYLRRGTVYVPTMGRTEAGYWLGIEPVDVESVADADALKGVLLRAINRGNPIVPTPTRKHFPPDVMRRHCGMKSFSAFERTAQLWSISQNADSCVICPWRRSARYRGAWEEDHERETVVPADISLEEIARRAARIALSEMPPTTER
jgi:hypothetical protein